MRVALVLSWVTVIGILVLCKGLDDDEDDDKRKFSVTFFQFNPKELGILGGGHHKKKDKRNIAKSDIEPRTNNHTKESPSNETHSLSNATDAVKPENTTVATLTKSSNETKTVPHNTSAPTNASKASEAEPMDDVNIMNALIDLAVSKNTTVAKNTNKTDSTESKVKQSVSELKGNKTAAAGNATNEKVTKSHIPKRDKVLDPNPKPSVQEANLNVKPPSQLENKEHSPLIHAENTTNSSASEDKHETMKNSVEMIKNDTAANATPEKVAEAPKNETLTEEEEKKRKLEKDKQTNREIKEAAKDIKPIVNTVGDPSKEIHDMMSGNHQQKQEIPIDEKTKKHRSDIAEFVPLYHSTTARDHKLSFQVGSMKHPKHNIHPKCHACALNSTYKECVKKSTLKLCNEGLNNICFTKSTKKNGIVTYEMGCADHNNCVHAKAFPCKDGSKSCFTCCQFDRCNSSPHHGDYELDELNLAELSDNIRDADFSDTTTLDTKSDSTEKTTFWPVYMICLLACFAFY